MSILFHAINLFVGTGEMHRGCLSDTSYARMLCDQGFGVCKKCSFNGCNNEPKHRPSTLSCMHCNDSAECAFGLDESKHYRCHKMPLFGDVETCYTFNPDGGSRVERGCTLDSDLYHHISSKWCEFNRYCTECYYPGCNSENVKFHSCAVCDTAMGNKDCDDPHDISKYFKSCSYGSYYSYEKRGCFTWQHSKLHLLFWQLVKVVL